jgi:hypothetical protein
LRVLGEFFERSGMSGDLNVGVRESPHPDIDFGGVNIRVIGEYIPLQIRKLDDFGVDELETAVGVGITT